MKKAEYDAKRGEDGNAEKDDAENQVGPIDKATISGRIPCTVKGAYAVGGIDSMVLW